MTKSLTLSPKRVEAGVVENDSDRSRFEKKVIIACEDHEKVYFGDPRIQTLFCALIYRTLICSSNFTSEKQGSAPSPVKLVANLNFFFSFQKRGGINKVMFGKG